MPGAATALQMLSRLVLVGAGSFKRRGEAQRASVTPRRPLKSRVNAYVVA